MTLDLSIHSSHDASSSPKAICMEMRHGTDRQTDPPQPYGSVSKVEMTAPMALIDKALFPSISTFETPPIRVSFCPMLWQEGDAEIRTVARVCFRDKTKYLQLCRGSMSICDSIARTIQGESTRLCKAAKLCIALYERILSYDLSVIRGGQPSANCCRTMTMT